MGFFETLKTGYSIMWNDAKRGWQNHGAQILTGGGTSLLLLANGLFTRKALKEETRKAIEDARKVIADQGNEKDLEYLTTKKGKKVVKNADGTSEIAEGATGAEGDGLMVQADPSIFKLYLSPETTPWLYSDNLYITKANIEDIERTIERIGWKNGVISLNDMRRECASMNNPRMYDVGAGGIFGKTFEPYKGDDGHMKFPHFQLGGWRDDADFMDGRKVGVWVIFPCDKEPIIGKVDSKLMAPVEVPSI